MPKNNISFSSDEGKISREDLDETSRITEEYFGTEKDPSQMATTPQNRDWIYKNARGYLNIIRNNGEIIGYVFMLPCNKRLMEDFVTKKIDEATLFEGIKKMKLDGVPETIYLCASIVKEEFRGKGLATAAFVKAINYVTHNLRSKPTLFYWRYSKEGEKLAKRVEMSGLELRVRW